MKTKTEQTNEDITALLKARNALLWITSSEELRVERALVEAAAQGGYDVHFWDCATGLTNAKGEDVEPGMEDPLALWQWIRDHHDRRIFVLRDLHHWTKDPMVVRHLRSLARQLQSTPRGEARAMVVVTPSSEVPKDLEGDAVLIDYPLPERAEVASILDGIIEALPAELQSKAAPNGQREAAIDAALGLTAEGVARCYSRSLVTQKRIDPVLVAQEKKRVINAVPGVEWFDPDPRGLDGVAGLDVLKPWLMQRRAGFTREAREFGLPAPKGVLLVGVPGCGKSLTAKCVAAAWQVPLLRLDLGALRSKWVGESEGNMRRALAVAETVSPCVLWLDEIEKALAGSGGQSGDGGVAADALGSILSWMQDREGSVFVVATANDVGALPPELLRKGRFDDLFFVDLPTRAERRAVVEVTLRQHKRDPKTIESAKVAAATDGFSGAELAALVPDALFTAFANGKREITTEDVLTAAKGVVPLARTAAERITRLREWAKSRARLASTPEKQKKGGTGRALDL